MKASNSAEQSLDFRIIIYWSSYCLVRLCNNIMYNTFITEQSHEYQSQNISTRFWYFSWYYALFWSSNDRYTKITFYYYYIGRSNHCSTFLKYHHLYNIFIVKWSTFDHNQNVTNQNQNLEDYLHTLSYKIILQSNEASAFIQ